MGGVFGTIPVLLAIIVGYVVSVPLGLVDFAPVAEAAWIGLPNISTPRFDVGAIALVAPVAIVVVTVEREASGSLGYVQHKAGGAAMPTASHFENRIAELMGGMAAESLYFGDYSAGNSSDLQQATALARDYVARYGMSPAGYVQYVGDARASVDQAEIVELPREVRDEMNRVMASSFERAKEVIEAHRPVFDRLVEVLLAEQTISGERIMALWDELSEKEAPHEQG